MLHSKRRPASHERSAQAELNDKPSNRAHSVLDLRTSSPFMSFRAKTLPFYASLLDACSAAKDLRTLKQIHARTLALRISTHDFLLTKLVSAYAGCAQMREAHIIFSSAYRRPTFLYNSLIRAYSSLDQFYYSLLIFCDMIGAGKPVDRHTLPAVLKSCAGLPSLGLGKQVHVTVLVNGYSLDLANNNALISMYEKSGDLGSARKVFDRMSSRNEISWSAMMSGYGKRGMAYEVFHLFDEMREAGIKVDEVTFTALLTACSHGGQVEDGKKCFEMMEQRFGIKPRLEHYTCLVDMLGRAGLVEEAEQVIMGMDLSHDEALLRTFLLACRTHGKMEAAERIATRLKRSGNRDG